MKLWKIITMVDQWESRPLLVPTNQNWVQKNHNNEKANHYLHQIIRVELKKINKLFIFSLFFIPNFSKCMQWKSNLFGFESLQKYVKTVSFSNIVYDQFSFKNLADNFQPMSSTLCVTKTNNWPMRTQVVNM